jgi:predicted MFS family arabinose efflux permease
MTDEDQPTTHVPHVKTIIFMSVLIIVGFSAVTGWVLIYSDDATTKGALVQTWNNLAIAVGAFWLGSSLGGKIHKK